MNNLQLLSMLDLDYFKEQNEENQCNYLITKVINNINNLLTNNIKYFVLDYRDDLYSYVAFSILQGLSSYKNIPILFHGKVKKTKKYFEKKYKIKYYKEDILMPKEENKDKFFISSFNPIYYVWNVSKNSKVFYSNYNIIDKFTLRQVEYAAENFYGVDEKIKIDKHFRKLFEGKICYNNDNDDFNFSAYFPYYKQNFTTLFVKLTGKESDNIDEIINEINKRDNCVVLYYMPFNLSFDLVFRKINSAIRAPRWGHNIVSIDSTMNIDFFESENIDFFGEWEYNEKSKILNLLKMAKENKEDERINEFIF